MPVARRPNGDLPEVDEGHYVVEREVARGGMGKILLARDQRTDRTVALKQIPEELLEQSDDRDRAEYRARFEREARITAQLQHPAIVPVYEIGKLGDAPFFAMKMVRGEPFDRLLEGTRSLDDRLALLDKVIAVADAIAYAHERGVIHRDLKPANILCGRHGETVVIDWGLAKPLDGGDEDESSLSGRSVAPDLTEAGVIFGTPQYMSPEQGRGEPLDQRADVYAIGAILYRLLSGRAPYLPREHSQNKSADVVAQLVTGPPTPLNEVEASVPRDLQSIVTRAMAHDRDDRYADATELAADLRRFQSKQLVAVHDYSLFEHLRRWYRDNRLTGLATLVAVAMAIAAVVALYSWVQQADRAKEEATNAAEQAHLTHLQLLERGRRALLEGHLAKAALLLAHAYQVNPDDVTTQLLLGHATEPLQYLQWTVKIDGCAIAKVLDDGSLATICKSAVTIWDVNSRTSRKIPLGDYNGQIDVARNGKHAVTGRDGVLEIWDLDAERVINSFRIPGPLPFGTFQPPRPSISDDGRWVSDIVYRDGSRLVTWDTRTAEELVSVPTDVYTASLLLEFDSNTLTFSRADGIEYIDLTSRERLARIPLPAATSLRPSPHSDLATARETHGSRTWLVGRQGIATEFDDFYLTAAIPRGERQVITVRQSGAIDLWELRPNQKRRILIQKRANGALQLARLRRDGRQLAIASDQRAVLLYDLGTEDEPDLRLQARLPCPGHVEAIDYSRDGRHLTIATRTMLCHYRTDMDYLATKIEVARGGWQTISPDGRFWLRASDDGATIWNTRDAAVVKRVSVPGAHTGGFSPDGKHLYLADGIRETANWKKIADYEGATLAEQVVVLGETGKLAITADQGTALVVDGTSGRRLGTFQLPDKRLSSPYFATVAADRNSALLAGSCGIATCVWNERGELKRHIPATFGMPMALLGRTHLAISPGGNARRRVEIYSLDSSGGPEVNLTDVSMARRPLDTYEDTPFVTLADGRRRLIAVSPDGTKRPLWESPFREGIWPRAQALTPKLVTVNGPESPELVDVAHGRVWARELPRRHPSSYLSALDANQTTLVTRGKTHVWIWPLPRERRDPEMVLKILETTFRRRLSREKFVVPLE